jgi:hypothetical protein
VNAIAHMKNTSGMTDKDIESSRAMLDIGYVLLCNEYVQDIYRYCLNNREETINLIKEIPNDVDGQELFMQRLPCRFDAPIRTPTHDNRLQYDRESVYELVSLNGNWSLFRKDSVVIVIDSLHFTERVICPAPRRIYVDSNGRVIEYDYKLRRYRDYDTKETIKHKLTFDVINKKISFHEKYVLIVRDNHVDFWTDNERVAQRYVHDCSHADYIYFNKGIVCTSEGQYDVNYHARRQLIVLCTIVNSDIALYVSQFLLL